MRKFLSVLLLMSIALSVLVSVYIMPASAYNLQNTSQYSIDEVDVANKLGFITEKQSYADMKAPINRLNAAQLAVLIYKRMTGENPVASNTSPFTDTYDENVSLAYELGIMSGKGDGTFAPADALTRQEMAKVFINLLSACKRKTGSVNADSVLSAFNDRAEIAQWAKDAMAILVKKDIMKGDSSYIYPISQVTHEQAYILAGRFYNAYCKESDFKEFDKPDLAIPTDRFWVNEEEEFVSIGWTNASVAEKYAVYVYYLDGDTNAFNLRMETTNTFMQIPVFNFTKGSAYAVRIGAYYENDSFEVFSNTHIFNYGECWHPEITNKEELASSTDFSEGITVNWKTNDIELNCILTVSDGTQTLVETTVLDKASYTFKDFEPGHSYTISTYGINADGSKTVAYDSVTVNVPANSKVPETTPELSAPLTNAWNSMTYNEKFNYILPTGKAFETEEEAKLCMTTLNVPVWRLNADGSKTSSTMSVTVHYRLAEVIYVIFAEIFNNEERFPFHDAGAYNWRSELVGGKTLSHHNYGTAIDLNYKSNYCIYPDGSIVGDHWLPGEDPYSFPADGIVVRTFKKYGFYWGGDWNNTKDYMHFSFLEQ